MKQLLTVLVFLSFCFSVNAQIKIKEKKYPSLFWEISGNGLKKPSYLFGTMHVSSKIAFNVSDSFYLGIKNADVVALETNPESWQSDMDKYDMGNEYGYDNNYNPGMDFSSYPNDYLTIRSLQADKYEKKLEAALYTQPAVINSLLYRSNPYGSSDFEEDTYLDMHIYQTGKKLGKVVTGVENYEESMRLMMEAYRDASKEKNKKRKNYDLDQDIGPGSLQDAYRAGNLDLLDSINKLNSFSDAFDEKFMYKRNEIQANSIDSILKKSALFVGVGAAHLPGDRGVIELLRKKGYTMRPVIMMQRDTKQKEEAEKIRVPVIFSTQTSDDGFYTVDIPGKLYDFGERRVLNQQQYSDMANGSFYVVTRVITHSSLWGDSEAEVAKKIDSVLYENVPGKILEKKRIEKNGYRGFDITNRTRRGDVQRYNIFITPFEVLVFKMSGNGNYVINGDEANHFFGSIQLKQYDNAAWIDYHPVYGGFKVQLPHEAFETSGNNRNYEAVEKATGNYFAVWRTDVHNISFVEEDAFDLGLMEESFASSGFIDKQLSKKLTQCNGYPSLDCKYKLKDGSFISTRYIIQGPHYYTLISRYKNENAGVKKFLTSFDILPNVYGEAKEQKDTALHFTATPVWYPVVKKEKIKMTEYAGNGGDDDDYGNGIMSPGDFGAKLFENDSTGEKVFVLFGKTSRYLYEKDSASVTQGLEKILGDDSLYIKKMYKEYVLGDKTKVTEMMLTDTGSSRVLYSKFFYKEGVIHVLVSECDTLTGPGLFTKSFFDTFAPSDSVKGYNPYVKKSAFFFEDYFSNDSSTRKKAIRAIDEIELDSSDYPMIKKAIASLTWADKKYLDLKKSFVSRLAIVKSKQATDFLKNMYYMAEDTVELQYAVLDALLSQKNQYAYNTFRDIITDEPPVLSTSFTNPVYDRTYEAAIAPASSNYDYSGYRTGGSLFMTNLYDSVQLTKTIIKDILPLMNIDDYEETVMSLLRVMIDSNQVSKQDYAAYFNKFLLEAKQEMKKQRIAERAMAIEKAKKEEEGDNDDAYYNYDNKDKGNNKLTLYATLLMPFWKENASVPQLFNQMLASEDKRLKYDVMIKMLAGGEKMSDTLIRHFASNDAYRYELYTDLKEMEKEKLFPATYKNQLHIGKSKLLNAMYKKPDTLVYVDKRIVDYKNRKGYVYIYKYRADKEDPSWKLASSGMFPLDTKEIDFKEKIKGNRKRKRFFSDSYLYDFTNFEETRLNDDEPVKEQIDKLIKKLLYSKRKSAGMFYQEQKKYGYDYSEIRF